MLEGKCELGSQSNNWRVVIGNTGEKFYITKELDKAEVKRSLLEVKQKGIESISVALAHSYTFFEQELEVGSIAEELGKNSHAYHCIFSKLMDKVLFVYHQQFLI